MQNIMFFLFKIIEYLFIQLLLNKVYLIWFYKQFLRKFIKINNTAIKWFLD